MRVKRGVPARAKHKKILNAAKGMQHYRTRSFRLAKQGVINLCAIAIAIVATASVTCVHCGLLASTMLRANWVFLTLSSWPVSEKRHAIDRKMLAELAVNQPKAFEAIVKTVKEAK